MATEDSQLVELNEYVLLRIFHFLDFTSLQKNATLVCKRWFNIIRNDINLSKSVFLLKTPQTKDEITQILKSWPRIRHLTLANQHFGRVAKSFNISPCPELQDIQWIGFQHNNDRNLPSGVKISAIKCDKKFKVIGMDYSIDGAVCLQNQLRFQRYVS